MAVGHTQFRPVIDVVVRCRALEWLIVLTLTKRDTMGFRMLLGRQAVRNTCVVDSGRSYVLGSRPSLLVRRLHRGAAKSRIAEGPGFTRCAVAGEEAKTRSPNQKRGSL